MFSRARSLAKTLAPCHVFSIFMCVALLLLVGCTQRLPDIISYPAPRETASQPPVNLPSEDIAVRSDVAPLASPTLGGEVRVGLVLPLSGRHAKLGEALQQAATLALFDRYAALSPQMAATKVVLVTKDSGDTAESARRAVKEAITEGAKLVIGPVFGEHVAAATPIAQSAGVPLISFSNNPGVAGGGAYIFGFSPEAQTRRVIDFAVNRNLRDIASLVPNSAYGQSVAKAVRETLELNDETLRAQGVYSAQGVGLESAISRILPHGSAPGFQGLFLPEGSAALDIVMRSLDARGLRAQYGVRLLGTGLWDDAALVRRVNLQGAWLATSPPNLTRSFERRFNNVYAYVPPRIASLSYDAVSLAVTLATTGRGFSHDAITQPAGFAGPANGIFRFLKSGLSERGLAVVEVNGRNFRVISPAPTAFNIN